MKKQFTILGIVLVVAIFAMASLVMAQDKAKATFVGEKACKMCHKAQFDSWSKTKHATAFAALKPEEQKKAECTGCHMTGKTAADSAIVNVSCEACHGAGSEYKKPTIMSAAKFKADKAAQMKIAVEAGLVMPTEATCVNCHKKEGNPNFKEFDFAKSKGLVHPVAAAPAK
ncbi:MAG: multiheme c-type cytochrome [Candidatus Zixiibacteriota bacterium]